MRDLEDRCAIQDPKLFEALKQSLQDRAYPVDPEADGDFSREELRMVRGLLGGTKLKDDAGKTIMRPKRRSNA